MEDEDEPSPTPSPPRSSARKSVSEVSSRSSSSDEDFDGAPTKVEEWNPMDSSDDDPAEGSKRRRKSSKLKGSGRRRSGSSEDGSSSSTPVGYFNIYSVCGIVVVFFGAYYYWPSLRKWGAGGSGTPSARFKDIGARTSEEELGLVQAAERFEDDDDML